MSQSSLPDTISEQSLTRASDSATRRLRTAAMRRISAAEAGTSRMLVRKPPTEACQPTRRDSSSRMTAICASKRLVRAQVDKVDIWTMNTPWLRDMKACIRTRSGGCSRSQCCRYRVMQWKFAGQMSGYEPVGCQQDR